MSYQMPTEYGIEETPMFPNSFKLIPIGNYKATNSWTEFFPNVDDAKGEIVRRGAKFRDDIPHCVGYVGFTQRVKSSLNE